jgi:hypothetical protein
MGVVKNNVIWWVLVMEKGQKISKDIFCRGGCLFIGGEGCAQVK